MRIILALLLLASPALADPAAPRPVEKFELRVRFQTPITPDFELKTVITTGAAFLEKTPHEGGSFNMASGMLLPIADGKYPLVLTYIDWGTEKDNEMGATKLVLTLDQPQSFGVSGGLIHTYTVTLARLKS